MEDRRLLSVTPYIMMAGSSTKLANNTTIYNWPVGVALPLQAVYGIDLSTGKADGNGTLFTGNSSPGNTQFLWQFQDTAANGTSNADYGAGKPRATVNAGVSQDSMTGFNASHVYDTPGTYVVKLTTTDETGAASTTPAQITVQVTDSSAGVANPAPAGTPVPFGSSASTVSSTNANVIYVDDSTATISSEGSTAVAGTSPTVVHSGSTVVNGPLTSFAAAITALQNNAAYTSGRGVEVRFLTGDTFPVSTGALITASNVLLGAYSIGSATLTGNRPVLQASGTGIAALTLSATKFLTVQDIAFKGFSASIIMGGNSYDTTIRDCQFIDGNNDIQTTTSRGDTFAGALVQGCQYLQDTNSASGHGGYVIFGQGDDWVVRDNDFTGGENATSGQPYLRWSEEDYGGLERNILIEDNKVSNRYGINVNLAVRGEANFVYVSHNVFLDAPVFFGNGGAYMTSGVLETTTPPDLTSEPENTYGVDPATGKYRILGPTYTDQAYSDFNWVVFDGNRSVGGQFASNADVAHLVYRNNASERLASEPTTNAVSPLDNFNFANVAHDQNNVALGVQDLELIGNTAYNSQPSTVSGGAAAYDFNNPALTGVTFVNNIGIVPNAGGYAYDVLFNQGFSFALTENNLWQTGSGGFFKEKTSGSDVNFTYAQWKASAFGGNDYGDSSLAIDNDASYYPTTLATLAVNAGNGAVGTPYASDPYDLYGNVRQTASWTAGAVQTNGQPPTTPTPTPTPTPTATWTSADIGSVASAGSTSVNGTTGEITLTAGGGDIGGTADSFRFDYQTMAGNGTVTAEVANQYISGTGTISGYAKAGVMVRAGVAANAAMVAVSLTPTHGVQLAYRATAGGTVTVVTYHTPATNGEWVRIQRTGTATFAGQYSSDGSTWTTEGTATIAANQDVLAGLAVATANAAQTNVGVFDGASVTQVELLTNGGFETGSISPWTNNTPGITPGPTITTANTHAGTYAVALSAAGSGIYYYATGLTAGVTYTFQGYVDAASSTDALNVSVKDYGGGTLQTPVTSTTYALGSVSFTEAAGNTTAVLFVLKPSGTGTSYLDDFSLFAN